MLNERLIRQLAADCCCSEQAIRESRNSFSVWQPLPDRRVWEESPEGCFLKIIVYKGGLHFTGRADIIARMEKRYKDARGEWFFEYETLQELQELIRPLGYAIDRVHPFFSTDELSWEDDVDYDIVWYEEEDIGQFRDDVRFSRAYSFDPKAPDVLGVAAVRNGEILGMAGVSADSPETWQIGIDVLPAFEGQGIATTLVTRLKNEILRRGKTPFYGTAFSHTASQRVAVKSGFLPAWAELTTVKDGQ